MTRPSRCFPLVPLALLMTLASCGRDKFQQELDFEKVAIPLVREVQSGGYSVLTTKELHDRVRAGQGDWLLIDAMPYESFASGHIENAVNFVFPKDSMSSWDEAETGGKSEEDYAALLGADKSRAVVIYCGYATCLRSHNAAQWARSSRIGTPSLTPRTR
ncbi:MAG: hypothetical protein KDC95_21100, partial [Planctomycetes bacterium]|nr:hypothetical protein [Planctomycetota bacterium]